QLGAVGQPGAADASLPEQPLQADILVQIDAMPEVQSPEIVGGLGCGNTLEDAWCSFDEGDAKPELRRNRSRFEPDIAAADDQHMAAGAKFGLHSLDIGEIADM